MEILTDRLCLREFEERDFPFFTELETNEACLKYESDTVPTDEQLNQKFQETFQDKLTMPRTRYRLMISTLAGNETVGKIVIWKIDDTINEWEMGWDVHPQYWGNGYAPEAAKALLNFAFATLKAHRIQALCNDLNCNSERVMIKIGMLKEGTLRGVRLLHGSWYGSHIYSLLESEYAY